jgi:hypothetical protein
MNTTKPWKNKLNKTLENGNTSHPHGLVELIL